MTNAERVESGIKADTELGAERQAEADKVGREKKKARTRKKKEVSCANVDISDLLELL